MKPLSIRLKYILMFSSVAVFAIIMLFFYFEKQNKNTFDWVPMARQSELMILMVQPDTTPEDVRKLLKKHPELINQRVPGSNRGPIFNAVNTGNIEIVRTVLEYGADVNEHIDKVDYQSSHVPVLHLGEHSPIHEAVFNNDIEMVKFLVENGADYNRTSSGETPVEIAERKKYEAIFDYLSGLD